MKIHDDHLYHGSALIQIAEHPSFTAINSLKIGSKIVRVAYRINDDIAVYLKYASKPTGRFKEYIFTFTQDHRAELSEIAEATAKLFVALVCVKDREICVVPYSELKSLFEKREINHGGPEDALTVLVTAPAGKSLRLYMNASGKKKTMLTKEMVISRSAFPGEVFG